MGLEFNQWINFLENDSKLKEDKVDVAWKTLVKRRKAVQEDLFNLLYNNRYLNFSHEDWNLHFKVDEDKVKAWNKRHYNRYDTYIFVKEKVPQVLKQTSITRYTAEKIALVLDGMKYCDQLLSTQSLAKNPIETKTTEELFNEKRHDIGIQLEIPFDGVSDNANQSNENIEENKISKSNYSSNRRNFLTDEQLDELYKKDDNEKYYQL